MAKSKRIFRWIGIGILGFVVALLVGLVVFVCVSLNNLESTMVEKTEFAKTALIKKTEAIMEFADDVDDYSQGEEAVFSAIKEAVMAVEKAETVQELSKASEKLDKAYADMLAIEERYYFRPRLDEFKQNVKDSENRIVIETEAYNEAAEEYNEAISEFPGDFISGIFGYDEVELFYISFGSNK